jgi:hypothetical protein
MGAERESKAAIRELAGLLNTDRVEARAFLREVQLRCGPVPFRAIVDEIRTSGIDDIQGIAERVKASRPFGAAEQDHV